MRMNESEIEYAVDCIQDPAYLRDAAQFLLEFMDLINSISDGWPYWAYGTKCSSDLQEIVNNAVWPVNRMEHARVSAADVSKACRKVRLFLNRCKQTKDKPQVRAFLKEWAKP